MPRSVRRSPRARAPPCAPPSYTRAMTPRPILPYERTPLAVHEWDPGTVEVARNIATMVNATRPDLVVDHIGSSAVPGLPGKNVVDLGIPATPDDVPAVADLLE